MTPISDPWSAWSTTAGSDSPASTATPEIDGELRNIKAQTKANCVDMSSTQTIAGVKTFSSFPILPITDPTTAYQAAHKAYVDEQISGAGVGVVGLSGDQTVAGVKTFTSFPVTPSSSPTTAYQTANKSYVDAAVAAIPADGLSRAKYIKCTNHQTSGTAGGQATSGSWQTVVLNTKDADYGSLGTLSSSQLTLPSGTYYAHGMAPMGNVSVARLRLVEGVTILLVGSNVLCYTSSSQSILHVTGYFTLSASSAVVLQYRTAGHTNANDLGQAASFGDDEIYGQLEIWKVA